MAAPEPASRKHLPPGLHQAEGPGKRPPGDLVNAVPLYLEPQESPLPSYLLTPPLGSQLSGSRLLRELLPLTLSAQNRAGWTSPLRRRWRRRQGARAREPALPAATPRAPSRICARCVGVRPTGGDLREPGSLSGGGGAAADLACGTDGAAWAPLFPSPSRPFALIPEC